MIYSPLLQNIKDGLYFNISHSGKYVVIAVDREDIGVDIQKKQLCHKLQPKCF